jgi:hypothetical protein
MLFFKRRKVKEIPFVAATLHPTLNQMRDAAGRLT